MTHAGDPHDAASRDPRVAVRPTSRTARHGGSRRAKPRRRHSFARGLFHSFLVVSLVCCMSLAYFYRHLNGNLNQVSINGDILTKRPPKPKYVGPSGPINILVMASDTRDCDGCHVDGLNGGGGSDTTILLHLSADRRFAYGISIPRDSLVDRPECRDKNNKKVIHPAATKQMWNAAFSIGGEACTVAQFEQNTGIRIDHYVTVNFGSFKNMVDAIGGVKVCVPEDIDSRDYGIFIKAGTRKISGKAALAYVRVRHGIGDGSDIGRVKRQQAFIGAMVSQVLSAGTLTNPVKVANFLGAATSSLTLDMNLTSLIGLALQFKGVGASRIKFITVPFEYPAWDPNRVVWTAEAKDVWQRVLDDKPLPASVTSGAIDVSHLPGQTDTPEPTPTASPSAEPSHSPSASPSSGASGSPSPSASASEEANGRTEAENRALRQAGLCT